MSRESSTYSSRATYGLAALTGRKRDARVYTQDQLIAAVEKAYTLIHKYDATHGVIRSKDFSTMFPSCALSNAVRKHMRLTRCEVGGGDQGYPVELRFGVWRGL